MKINKIKSNAKLNLALNITGKKKVLHKIESIIGFIDLHDVISINQHNGKKHHISFYGKFSKNIGKKNTIQKLFQILDKENLLKNKKFKIKIKKFIPQEAGLGGGSMNAASVFNYLVKKKIINPNLTEEQKKIMFENSTERAHSSPLNNEKRKGFFHCANCGAKLFSSEAKFDSGTGWPSFTESLPGAFKTKIDYSF